MPAAGHEERGKLRAGHRNPFRWLHAGWFSNRAARAQSGGSREPDATPWSLGGQIIAEMGDWSKSSCGCSDRYSCEWRMIGGQWRAADITHLLTKPLFVTMRLRKIALQTRASTDA